MKSFPSVLLVLGISCYFQGVSGKPEVEVKDIQSPARLDSLREDLNGTRYSDIAGELMNSHVLLQAGENSLNDGNSDNTVAIRVTVKPTFGKPVILKVHQKNNGHPVISVKRLSGLGGYELGHIEMIGQVEIEKDYFASIVAQANDPSLIGLSKMTPKQRQQTAALDGVLWSVEIHSEQRLKVIDIYSPVPLNEDATGLSPYLTKKAVANLIKLVNDIADPVGIIIDGVNRK